MICDSLHCLYWLQYWLCEASAKTSRVHMQATGSLKVEKIPSLSSSMSGQSEGFRFLFAMYQVKAAAEDVSYMSPTPKSPLISMDLVSNPSLISHRHPGEASSQSLHHGKSHRRSSPERWLVPASRVNYLLLCSAQGSMVSSDICVYTALWLCRHLSLSVRDESGF